MDNLFRDLEQAWARDGRSADAVAALARWSGSRPAAAAYPTPADLVAASHSRHDPAAVQVLEQLTDEAASDPWATRTVLQALLPGLAALTGRHRDLVGEGPEPFPTVGELDHFVVCTAFERITLIAAEAPTFRLRRILDSTWSRLRTHAAAHRRDWRSRRPLSEATGHVAPPPRTDAEELAAVLVDAVERRVLRPADAGLVYSTRVVGHAPAEVASALAWRTPSLLRRRHRVEQLLAAEVLGQPRPRGCYIAPATA